MRKPDRTSSIYTWGLKEGMIFSYNPNPLSPMYTYKKGMEVKDVEIVYIHFFKEVKKNAITEIQKLANKKTEKLAKESNLDEIETELFNLNSQSKLIQALYKHINTTDNLVRAELKLDNASNLSIYSIIERDGKEYIFKARTILAGGRGTSQCLHTRYITKGSNIYGDSKPPKNELKEIKRSIKKYDSINITKRIIKRCELNLEKATSRLGSLTSSWEIKSQKEKIEKLKRDIKNWKSVYQEKLRGLK